MHLGTAAKVNAGISERDRLVLEQQLEIAIVPVSGGVRALAVIDQFAILHSPMSLHDRSPLLDLSVPFAFGHGLQFSRVEGLSATPAGKVGTVEEGDEAFGRLFCSPASRGTEQERNSGES